MAIAWETTTPRGEPKLNGLTKLPKPVRAAAFVSAAYLLFIIAAFCFSPHTNNLAIVLPAWFFFGDDGFIENHSAWLVFANTLFVVLLSAIVTYLIKLGKRT